MSMNIIDRGMDFFVKKMACETPSIANTMLLFLSFGNRIIFE